MKKKIGIKFIALVISLLFAVQVTAPAYASGLTEEQPQAAITSSASSYAADPLTSALFRAVYFMFLRIGSIMPSSLKKATLDEMNVYDLGNGSCQIVGSFTERSGIVVSKYTIEMTYGDKAFWGQVVNNPSFTASAALNLGSVLINTVASYSPGYASTARQHISTAGMGLSDAMSLKSAQKNLTADGAIAAIAAFSIDQKILGIPQHIDRGPHCTIAACNDTTEYDIPDSEIPAWVNNGPAVNLYT